jgi:superfamily II DNA/RNA helicase
MAHFTSTLDIMFQKIMAESDTDKVLIFFCSQSELELAGKQLGIPHCHGSMTCGEIQEILDKLRHSEVQAIACTGVIRGALDDDIRWIFLVDYPLDMLLYIQESG